VIPGDSLREFPDRFARAQSGAVGGGQRREAVARRLRFAAVPQDRLFGVARATVVQEARVVAHRLDQADAPERGRAPLGSGRIALGPPVGEVRPHVVEEQVRHRMDHLVRELGILVERAGLEPRRVARAASGRVEQLLAALGDRIVEIAARGHRHQQVVGKRLVEIRVGQLRLPTVDRRGALHLRGRALLHGMQRRGDPDVLVKRLGGLLPHRRLACLPTESPDHAAAIRGRHVAHAPGDAIVVGVLGIGERRELGFRHGLQKPHTDQLRRDPRRDQRPGNHRSIAQVLERVAGESERVRRAVGVTARVFLDRDHRQRFGGDPLVGIGLELATVGWLVRWWIAWCAEPEQQPRDLLGRIERWASAAVGDVTALAGSRVVQRPEAVSVRIVGARRDQPVLVGEHATVAESHLVQLARVVRRVVERVQGRVEHRGVASQERSRRVGPEVVTAAQQRQRERGCEAGTAKVPDPTRGPSDGPHLVEYRASPARRSTGFVSGGPAQGASESSNRSSLSASNAIVCGRTQWAS
jgi:hypothetical protein